MMSIINAVLGIPLGYAIYLAYWLTNSYGLAILIFALIVRIVVFPVNVLAQKNSIRLLQLQPSLTTLKRRYTGDKERLSEEQYNLFKKERYSPFVGLIPLFIQLFLVIGMLQVMYHPLQHMLHLENDIIEAMVSAARSLFGLQNGAREQLLVMEALHHPENLPAFQAALKGFQGADESLRLMVDIDLNFLGVNLGETPSFINPTSALIVPLLSGLTSLAFCLVQNLVNPGALGQSKGTKLGLTIFTVAFSLYFAFVTPTGVGIYWTAGNLLSIVVVFLLNALYNPKRLAGEALALIKAEHLTPEQVREERQRKKDLSILEKKDATLFRTAKKHLVFYALTGGQYKYYKEIIEYLLDHSEIEIHYLTNDPDDAIFHYDNEQLIPYYVSQQKAISLFLKLDTDILVTTVPDLQSYHMKRSIIRENIEYIYTFHGLASTHLVLRETALDHFDTIFCVGPHQAKEVRRREELASLPRKNLVKAGYGLYDQLVVAYNNLPSKNHDKQQILIAPSWQTDNIMDICIDAILEAILGEDYTVIVRPHPQYVQMYPERFDIMLSHYSHFISSGMIVFDLDFSNNNSIFMSDLLITDWSGIAFEFSYCTLKPCIFIDTPMKVMNPRYSQYGLEILDISLRDKVGVSVEIDSICDMKEKINHLLDKKDTYKNQIEQIVQQYIYHPGRNGEAGGSYIINKLKIKV